MKTLVIADGEHSFREPLKRLLKAEREPVEIYEAATGHEAASLDLVMPDLNGLEAAQRIRAEWPGMPVVIFSVHSHASYKDAAAGADTFLQKKTLGQELSPPLLRFWREAGRS
ncbi:MAG: response regulator [Terriglobales bacterium]